MASIMKSETLAGSASSQAVEEFLELYVREPALVFQALAEGGDDLNPLFVQAVLADRDCFSHLCDGRILTLAAATKVAGILRARGANFELMLARQAARWSVEPRMASKIVRALQILDDAGKDTRISSVVWKLARSGNSMIRSRAWHLIARCSPSDIPLGSYLADEDPRVTANVIEGLLKSNADPAWIGRIVTECAGHGNNRVAANAIVGLYRMGEGAHAVVLIRRMTGDERALFRSSAAWAMGRMAGAGLREDLNRLRQDPSHVVRWSALRSLIRLQKEGKTGQNEEKAA